jgi:dUTP pyrophosphatase
MDGKMEFLIQQLEHAKGLPLPAYQTDGAAGLDLYACVDEPIALKPMERKIIPCGFKMALPIGFEAQIRPRSGLALKHGLSMPNSPGTIDADYRGEVGVLLINLGADDFVINRGDRIAQMIINKVERVQFKQIDTLPGSNRGEGGFGSTGTT